MTVRDSRSLPMGPAVPVGPSRTATATTKTLTPAIYGISFGTEVLAISDVKSAVNYLTATNAATGSGPTLAPTGTDANIQFNLNGKGTKGVAMTAQANTAVPLAAVGHGALQTGDLFQAAQTGGTFIFEVSTVANAVNGLQVTGAATGSGTTLATIGVDAAVALNINTKSTGNISLQPGGLNGFQVVAAAGAVNGLQLTPGATGQVVLLQAFGTDAAVSLLVAAKGAGNVTVRGQADGAAGLIVQGNSATQTGDILDVYQNAGGSLLFSFTTVANAVNGLIFTAAATTGQAVIAAGGTDAHVGLTLSPKGADTVRAQGKADNAAPLFSQGNSATQTADLFACYQHAGGNLIFNIATASSATNGITITGTATGGAPSIAAIGTDAAVSLVLKSKGTAGLVNISPNGIAVFSCQSVASAINYFNATNGASGSGPILASAGSDANVNLLIQTKGTGTIKMQPNSVDTLFVSSGVVDIKVATVALGGGLAPLLGTIGGSGPATQAQNSWGKMTYNGATYFVPLWQ